MSDVPQKSSKFGCPLENVGLIRRAALSQKIRTTIACVCVYLYEIVVDDDGNKKKLFEKYECNCS